jgi:hypothetical protein
MPVGARCAAIGNSPSRGGGTSRKTTSNARRCRGGRRHAGRSGCRARGCRAAIRPSAFQLTINEVYPTGTPQGIGPIHADGVIDGKGMDQEVAPAPSDPPNANRDVLTFRNGTLTVLSTGGNSGAPKVDDDCNVSFRITNLQTNVVGGTGAYANATGHFTDNLRIEGVKEPGFERPGPCAHPKRRRGSSSRWLRQGLPVSFTVSGFRALAVCVGCAERPRGVGQLRLNGVLKRYARREPRK